MLAPRWKAEAAVLASPQGSQTVAKKPTAEQSLCHRARASEAHLEKCLSLLQILALGRGDLAV